MTSAIARDPIYRRRRSQWYLGHPQPVVKLATDVKSILEPLWATKTD
jgi:hypothetical protein